ncbi:phage tail tape measure protein (plasmid) [Roseomonas marmotae]|uniref:phage tail tape measure protein n=1 Tax=Roseomonas marmotae TaxID=2768161 RepID=UPI001AD7A87E|nr:phage tail tape measure protein [Roseomonas marmotae]QTI81504.1 phage tail tape measure protein [Roseomonas marmotae]
MADKKFSALVTIGGTVASSLLSSIGQTQGKVRDLGAELRELKARQSDLGKAMSQNPGSGIEEATRQYAELGQQIDRTRTKIERLRTAQDRLARGKAMMASGSIMIGSAMASAATLGAPVMQAAEFETAMLGVAKQVEGARDENGKLTDVYYNMRGEIQKLAREIPTATNDIADMVAAGARMGVARDELIGFTRTAAMMSAAFELPAGELADQMGKIAGLFKIPIPQIGRLADTINYLDDNAISKGGDIIDFLTRTGGVAGSIKITGQQMAALGSTLLTLGEKSSTASTATSAMLQKLAAADKGTKKFKQAMKDIGLSVSAVQKGMQTDAQGTVLKVLEAVQKLPSTKRLGILTDLFGLEHSDTIAKLVSGIGEYRKQIEWATSDASRGSMEKEFSALLQTTNAQWQITKNTISELSVNIGSVLLPTLNSILGVIRDVTTALASFTKEHPILTGVVADFAGGAIGLVAALGAAKLAIGACTYAVGGLTTAMLANPVGMIVAAVVALGFAAYEVYKHWDTIKAYLSETWETIKKNVGAAWDSITSGVTVVVDKVKGAWDGFKTWFSSLWDSIVASVLEKIQPVIDFVRDPIGTIKTGVGNLVGGAVDKLRSLPGFGNMPPRKPAETRQAAAERNAAAVPALPGLASRYGTTNNTQNINVNVQQQPGQSASELADAIVRRMQNDQRRRSGALMFDPAAG